MSKVYIWVLIIFIQSYAWKHLTDNKYDILTLKNCYEFERGNRIELI